MKKVVKIINFDGFADNKIKLEMPNISFITVASSLDDKKIKTTTNEYLKNIINKDDIVFIVCDSVKEDIIIKTVEIVKSLATLTIGVGIKDKLFPNLEKYVDTVVSIYTKR